MSFAKLQLSLAGVLVAVVALGFFSAHGAGTQSTPPPANADSAKTRCYVNCTSGDGALGCRVCAHACGLPHTFTKTCRD